MVLPRAASLQSLAGARYSYARRLVKIPRAPWLTASAAPCLLRGGERRFISTTRTLQGENLAENEVSEEILLLFPKGKAHTTLIAGICDTT